MQTGRERGDKFSGVRLEVRWVEVASVRLYSLALRKGTKLLEEASSYRQICLEDTMDVHC